MLNVDIVGILSSIARHGFLIYSMRAQPDPKFVSLGIKSQHGLKNQIERNSPFHTTQLFAIIPKTHNPK